MKLNTTTSIGWLDWLRVFACFVVVLAHVTDHFVARFDTNPDDFMAGVAWGAFYRPCVPLFTLMTGFLIFPLKLDMVTFYKVKLKRLLIPFFFWAVVSPIMFFLYLNSGVEIVSPCINMEEHSLGAMINRISCTLLNFNHSTVPLWYIYMLIGIYLFAPILSAFLKNATKKELQIILGIWVFTTTIPYLTMLAPALGYIGIYGNMNLFGMCDWNPYGTFYYFSGFIGYIVLGYYFKQYPITASWSKVLLYTIPMYLVGIFITYWGFLKTNELYPSDYTKLEVIWYFCSINVLFMTAPIFIWFQKLNWKSNIVVRKIASLSFGIFLCHFVFAQISYDLLYPILPISPYFALPIIALFAFAISYMFAYPFSLNKYSRKVVE